MIEEYKEKQARKHVPQLVIDPEALRWTPLISNIMLAEEERLAEQEVWFDIIPFLYSCIFIFTHNQAVKANMWSVMLISVILIDRICLWQCCGCRVTLKCFKSSSTTVCNLKIRRDLQLC